MALRLHGVSSFGKQTRTAQMIAVAINISDVMAVVAMAAVAAVAVAAAAAAAAALVVVGVVVMGSGWW